MQGNLPRGYRSWAARQSIETRCVVEFDTSPEELAKEEKQLAQLNKTALAADRWTSAINRYTRQRGFEHHGAFQTNPPWSDAPPPPSRV
jgi:hypothetical protein